MGLVVRYFPSYVSYDNRLEGHEREGPRYSGQLKPTSSKIHRTSMWKAVEIHFFYPPKAVKYKNGVVFCLCVLKNPELGTQRKFSRYFDMRGTQSGKCGSFNGLIFTLISHGFVLGNRRNQNWWMGGCLSIKCFAGWTNFYRFLLSFS